MKENTAVIGLRLKNFREVKGMTQQELELGIGASFGHISRIESGKINPTKETLLKISEELNLSLKEKLILLDLHTNPASDDEVKAAIEHCAHYFESTQNPVYLADDFWFTFTGNETMLKLIGAPTYGLGKDKFIKEHWRTHILQWLFDKRLGVRQRMPVERWEEVAVNQCVYFIGLVDYFLRQGQEWLEGLLEQLEPLEDFARIWEMAKCEAKRNLERKELSVTYIYHGDWYEFFIANSRVNTRPRFMVVEYVPAAIYRHGKIKETIKL